MVDTNLRRERREPAKKPRVVIVVGHPTPAGKAYRIEAPDRVFRMFGLLSAARDELDLAAVPPGERARVQRLLEVVSLELERSVSPALAGELHNLILWGEVAPGAAELRLEYAGLLGWASGLVVAMLDQLAVVDDLARPPGGPTRDRRGQVPVSATLRDGGALGDPGPAAAIRYDKGPALAG